MNRGELIFPALLIAVVVALIGGGFAAGYSWTVIAFPLGAAILVCALCAVQTFWAVAGASGLLAAGEEPPALTQASIAWVFALAIFVYGLGFVLGPAVYLLAYLRAHGSSWTLSGIIAGSSIVATWGLFIRFLQVPLPIEPLWMG